MRNDFETIYGNSHEHILHSVSQFKAVGNFFGLGVLKVSGFNSEHTLVLCKTL